MIEIPWGKFPLVDEHEHAHWWLQFYANIGRAPNTVVAYGRAVDDHLRFLVDADTDPLIAGVDLVAAWIGDMLSRPNPRGAVLVHLDSGAGLANATVQQRIGAPLLPFNQFPGRGTSAVLSSTASGRSDSPDSLGDPQLRQAALDNLPP